MEIIYEEGAFQCCLLEKDDVVERNTFNAIRTKWWCEYHSWERVASGQYEQDGYDSSATLIVMIHKGVVVGGCRLIMSDSNGLLPFMENSSVTEVNETDLEISRWCISKEVHPKIIRSSHLVMIIGTVKYLYNLGLSEAYMDVCQFLYLKLTGKGDPQKKIVHIDTCGELHSYKDEVFQPGVLDVCRSAQMLGLLEAEQYQRNLKTA